MTDNEKLAAKCRAASQDRRVLPPFDKLFADAADALSATPPASEEDDVSLRTLLFNLALASKGRQGQSLSSAIDAAMVEINRRLSAPPTSEEAKQIITEWETSTYDRGGESFVRMSDLLARAIALLRRLSAMSRPASEEVEEAVGRLCKYFDGNDYVIKTVIALLRRLSATPKPMIEEVEAEASLDSVKAFMWLTSVADSLGGEEAVRIENAIKLLGQVIRRLSATSPTSEEVERAEADDKALVDNLMRSCVLYAQAPTTEEQNDILQVRNAAEDALIRRLSATSGASEDVERTIQGPLHIYHDGTEIADKNGHVCTAENEKIAKAFVEGWNASLSATSGASAWRPISEAPKDGTQFLWAFGETRAIIRWPTNADCWNGGYWQPLPAPPQTSTDGG